MVFREMSRTLEKETSQVHLEDRAWAGWSSGEELSPRYEWPWAGFLALNMKLYKMQANYHDSPRERRGWLKPGWSFSPVSSLPQVVSDQRSS